MMDEEIRGEARTENTAEPEDLESPETVREEPGAGQEQPRRTQEAPKRTRNASAGANRSGDRVHASTAGDGTKNRGGTRSAPKKEKVQLKTDKVDRSSRPAHRVIPYVLLGVGVFLAICLLFDLICNFGNKLSDNPSAHWMGKVGYQICYGLFGTFGPAVFVMPLLLFNLAAFWKRYIAGRVTISKIVVSALFQIILSALIHVFCLIPLPVEERNMTVGELMEYGAAMTGGGALGGKVGYAAVSLLNVPGAIIIGIFLLLVSLFYFLGMTPQYLWMRLKNWRKLSAEKRVTLSEQEAEQAKREAETKMNRMKKQSGETAVAEVTEEGYPVGAVTVYEKGGKKHSGKEKNADEDADLPPMPQIDRRPDDLYVPVEVGRELRREAQANVKPEEETPAKQPAAEPQAKSSPAPQPIRPAATQPATATANAPVRPAGAPPLARPNNSVAPPYREVEPIFPRNTDPRGGKRVQKEDRDFDLKNVFIDIDDPRNKAPQRQHAPLPPEKPLPGSRPAGAGQPGAANRPAQGSPQNAQRPGTPGQPTNRPMIQPNAGQPGVAQRPAPAGTAPGARPAAGTKPIFRPIESVDHRDLNPSDELLDRRDAANGATPMPAAKPGVAKPVTAAKPDASEKKPAEVKPAPKPYVFPPISYLQLGEPMSEENRAEIEANMNQLAATFANFHIGIAEIAYSCGPTVTRYEVTPAPGVRVNSIMNLANDIALTFAVPDVRMAPIPGKNAIGIEVPNKTRYTIYLRNLLESKQCVESSSKLTAGLGADVVNKPVLFDISKMPHLLVAGATGMGKSVCINCVIMSILYRAKPDEVKLVLIDPKKVEFSLYKGIPHLLAPIITTPTDATGALQAAVEEMEKRFELIQEVGCREIKGYNETTKDDPDKPYMPYIVIIIDELADLMMTARDEVETSICRLAQKGRAAGIHIIIGTQRPSVDVVTGLIKANVPSRIACTVASQTDSRTILDAVGAEKLLGRGDMLYNPVGAMKPTRVQGAFVSDAEVEKACEFIRATNGTAVYDEHFTSRMKEFSAQCGNKGKGGGSGESLGDVGEASGDDAKYIDAIRISIEENRVSTSLLQRKLSVGYSRAAKMIDRMEAEGIVSKPDGSKPRNILITSEEFIERYMTPKEEGGE